MKERLEAAGHTPLMVSAKTDWVEALQEPADAVLAAGGDGTIHKVARALAGSDRPLVIIPLGTANNIARAFGYAPGSDPFARIEQWGEDERTLRVECARFDGEGLPFLEVVGAGAFASLLSGDDGKKRRLPLASLMAARRRLLDEVLEGPVLDTEITLDGIPVEGRYVLVACLRIPSFGPALWLAPEQRPDGDELTLVAVRNDQREPFAWWLATGEGDVDDFQLGTGTVVELASDGPLHVDDKLIQGTKGERQKLRVGRGDRSVRVLV
jgi:diacylglycerol kinase (ATP)